jgi:hypothetical protein
VILQKVPQLLQVFLLKHLCRLVLKEPCASLLAHFEKQGLFALGLFVEKLRDLLESRV